MTAWTPEWVADRLARSPGQRGDYDMNPEFAPQAGDRHRDAAVLIPLIAGPGEPRVLLTRRADHLAHHPGQIAFPGGRIDAADPSAAAAALREAEEEVGLPTDAVRLLGRIDDYITRTGYRVRPYVGWIDAPPAAWRLDPEETAEAFEPPLSALIDPALRRVEARWLKGVERRFYSIVWSGRVVWGATAGMLADLSDRLWSAPGREGAA